MLFFIFILFASSAGAQRGKFLDGFIVTKKGDTLHGQVNWIRHNWTESGLYYRKNESESPRHYSWSELSLANNLEENECVRVVTLLRNLEYLDPYNFQIRNIDSTTIQEIPLRQLYSGRKLSLFTYFEKTPFFFLYDGKQMIQLVQKYRYLTTTERMFDYERGRMIHITDVFRNQLAQYYNFMEDPKLRYILDNAQYDETSLRKLISRMDNNL